MQDRDWTGTAAAITALAMAAGVWLWPETAPPHATAPMAHSVAADQGAPDDMARWRDEARRWAQRGDGVTESVQLSAAAPSETAPAVIR